MKIAVIGAGISGLAAGRELARAGHQVVVFEEHIDYGGKLATLKTGKNKNRIVDIGVPFLKAESKEFKQILDELLEKELIQLWDGEFCLRNSDGETKTLKDLPSYYASSKGMNAVGKYLGRMLDVRFNEKVGGITHIGENRIKKRSWMLNFPTSATENFDAVIIAAPARQAYGILNLTADELEALKIISVIDEVQYSSQFSLIVSYNESENLEWNGLECEDDVISWISNESRKPYKSENTFVIYSTKDFAAKHHDENPDKVAELMLERLSEMLGGWAALPEWHKVYYWKYARAETPLQTDYIDSENDESPLALVGGYMNGHSIESAYLSGLKLGKYWVEKFSD